jgi:hypothetical protein
VRVLVVLLVAATACGRLRFDPVEGSEDARPPDDSGPSGDGEPEPALEIACGETVGPGTTMIGRVLEAAVTTRGLAAVWLDNAGMVFGTVLQAAPGGVAVVRAAVPITSNVSTKLWVAANGDDLMVLTQDAGLTASLLRGDLTAVGRSVTLDPTSLDGRAPIARRRGGSGFVAIASSSTPPTIYETEGASVIAHPLPALVGHTAASIVVDRDSYAVVTEAQGRIESACWYTQVTDMFAAVQGPASIVSTEQAGCDSVTASASAGLAAAAMAWRESDPASSSVWFNDTSGQAGATSVASDPGPGLPLITATSAGLAVTWRSSLGLRARDASGVRTISPTAGLSTLVTWDDRAIVVWTTPAGELQLTRLCP